MPIIEPIIRPPAEAESLLLQITTGCSRNTCTFCGAYREKSFAIKTYEEIKHDVLFYAKKYPNTRRIFLMDGDALVTQNQKLIPILDCILENFPKCARIASYANGYNITCRSENDLKELYSRKLRLIYMGLESGSQEILTRCHKRATVKEMVEAVCRLREVGIKSSVIVLLGLGGKKHSHIHIRATIEALNTMQPRYLSFLSVMLIPGTPLYDSARRGEFDELSSRQLLVEMKNILKGLELKKTIFRSNHASNFLPLEGRLPHDKKKLIATIDEALEGRVKLIPDFFRGL